MYLWYGPPSISGEVVYTSLSKIRKGGSAFVSTRTCKINIHRGVVMGNVRGCGYGPVRGCGYGPVRGVWLRGMCEE